MKKFRALFAVILVVVMVLAVCSGCGKKAEVLVDEKVPEAASGLVDVITNAKATKNTASANYGSASSNAQQTSKPAQNGQQSQQNNKPAQNSQGSVQTGAPYVDQTANATNNTIKNVNSAIEGTLKDLQKGDIQGIENIWNSFGNTTDKEYTYNNAAQQANAVINSVFGK